MDEVNSMAFIWGMLASLVVIIGFLFWVITAGSPPIERRASRWGALTGTVCAGLVVWAEWCLYTYVDATAGLFMAMPSALMAVAVLWFGGKAIYRMLGGGQVMAEPKIEIEDETKERQGVIWCQLRDLPQFRETLGGELINLATGDHLYWTELEGRRCIEMKLAGKTLLTASRFETLTKYLAVQQGLSQLLSVQ
jgi:hypothetical protein